VREIRELKLMVDSQFSWGCGNRVGEAGGEGGGLDWLCKGQLLFGNHQGVIFKGDPEKFERILGVEEGFHGLSSCLPDSQEV